MHRDTVDLVEHPAKGHSHYILYEESVGKAERITASVGQPPITQGYIMQGSCRNDLLAQSAQGYELSVPYRTASPIAAKMSHSNNKCMVELCRWRGRGVWEIGNHKGKQRRGECLCSVSIKAQIQGMHPNYQRMSMKLEPESQSLADTYQRMYGVWRRALLY